MMTSLRNYFLNLNLFEPLPGSNKVENETQRRTNIISTRIYLVVLILVLIIATFILWFTPQTTIVTINYPTKDQFQVLPIDAQCPCSRISLSYGDFTSFDPSFHQVCSSDFVSDRWIKAIYPESHPNFAPRHNQVFQSIGSAQFQALASFCRLSKASILQSITSFGTSALISPQVLSEAVLRAQTQGSIDQFQLTAPNVFRTQLQLMREMTMANRLITGLQTNSFFAYYITDNNQLAITFTNINYNKPDGFLCSCSTDLDCQLTVGIFDSTNTVMLIQIPGMAGSCWPVGSILLSTLECFYSQTCVDTIISFFPTTEKFTAMNELETSHFNPNSTVKVIVDSLMVEQWMTNISYDKYYAQCAPLSCTYSKVDRHNFVFVLAKLISLLSGLTIGLGFVIPIIVRFIQRLRNPEPTVKIPFMERLRQLKTSLKKLLVEINFFQHYPINNQQTRYQRYATRLYIFLIVISLEMLVVYTLMSTTIHRETILNPTESQYILLQEIYSDSLSCPCKSISMTYSTFITIQPHYHQVCSSDLVSSQWIDYNKYLTAGEYLKYIDYRLNAGSQFQSLAMFCNQAKQTIDDGLRILLQAQFVSSRVISQHIFISQINSLIEEWQSMTVNQYRRMIKLVQTTNQANLLGSTQNVNFTANFINLTTAEVTILPMHYSNCSCATFQSCHDVMGIYQPNSSFNIEAAIYLVPNFFIGCFPVEALLASTLQCFYNRSCVMDINSYISPGTFFNYSPLNASLNSPNETVGSLVNRLMVDSWSSNVSFTSYYNACAPSSCSFVYKRTNSLFFILTTIIGIFGGLSIAIKILIWIVLRLTETFIGGFSCRAVMHFIKSLFICREQPQMINRLHFGLVTMTLFVLYIFSAFTPQLKTIEIQNPSLSSYRNLATLFPKSLQCSCSQISVKYKSFLTIVPRFHQVCSSEFVSNDWVAFIYGDGDLVDRFSPTDFRYSAPGQFQLLASLCQLSQETVKDALFQLVGSDFINTQLLSSSLLDERIQTITNEFQVTTPNLFISILSLIRETTGANMIMSGWSTSWIIPPNVVHHQWGAETTPLIYRGCSCGLSSKCVQPSRGMLAGCYALEALFQATLECFYHQQCIDLSDSFKAMHVSSLNSSHFDINATIESITNELMVEEYTTNISYENYFAMCAPSTCSYSYIEDANIIEGIISLIAIYGGLVLICRWIAVIIIKVFRRHIQRINPILD